MIGIDALGNSENDQAIASLEQFANDPHPVVRRTAVNALRSLGGDEVDSVIANSLLTDHHPSVREFAANALRSRELTATTRGALVAAMRDETSVPARHTAVSVAATQLQQDPSLLGPLSAVASEEQDEQIRTLAEDAVQAFEQHQAEEEAL